MRSLPRPWRPLGEPQRELRGCLLCGRPAGLTTVTVNVTVPLRVSFSVLVGRDALLSDRLRARLGPVLLGSDGRTVQ